MDDPRHADLSVLVAGGGFAGCAAALAAAKAGARVVLLEKNDVLLGTANLGGIIRNNGRWTAAEELIAMGAGELIGLCDRTARHRNVDFPGHRHATLCDCVRLPGEVSRLLATHGVTVLHGERIRRVSSRSGRVLAAETESGGSYRARAFVDATGTSGPLSNCTLHGNGCAMCAIKCPSFGGRLGLAALAGIAERVLIRDDGGWGAMSGSCSFLMESLGEDLERQLRETGIAVLPVSAEARALLAEAHLQERPRSRMQKLGALLVSHLRDARGLPQWMSGLGRAVRDLIRAPRSVERSDHLSIKACRQYALPNFAENWILLDTGHAKLMTSYWSGEVLRRMPGMAGAVPAGPLGGSRGNSMRFLALSPCDASMAVTGLENVYCAGEKVGLVGHTEAMVTGSLAGLNAARTCLGLEASRIPESLACGDLLAQARGAEARTASTALTFAGSSYFERMKTRGLYSVDAREIQLRVREAGSEGFFAPMAGFREAIPFREHELVGARTSDGA